MHGTVPEDGAMAIRRRGPYWVMVTVEAGVLRIRGTRRTPEEVTAFFARIGHQSWTEISSGENVSLTAVMQGRTS